MILQENLGYFFKYKSELFHEFCHFKALIEKQSGLHIKSLGQTEEENISQNNLCVIAEKMGYTSNLQQGIHHSKMELLKGKIEPSWTW